MLALQFATATANLASQNAFLFLATHGPIFSVSGFRWISDESLLKVFKDTHMHLRFLLGLALVAASLGNTVDVKVCTESL